MLSNAKLRDCKIYHYTSLQPSKRANSALLMGTFMVVMLRKTADEACTAFQNVEAFLPYVDASYQPSTFELYIEDCLKGFEKAYKLHWFDPETFDLKSYENFSALDQGGFNWIIPSKLLAFVCPASERTSKYPALTPELYANLFKSIGVTDVIRLNNKTYEGDRFERLGIRHHELYFLDGSVPSEAIVQEFLNIVENTPGAVAVHCKAGLGRTATLIGCYAIKHFQFTGLEFIGWARICRPGSVLGPQQQFLCDKFQISNGRTAKCNTNIEENYKAKFGDYGQSNRLISRSTTNLINSNSKLIMKNQIVLSKGLSMKTLQQKKK